MDDAKCEAVSNLTERDGDVLIGDKAAPFVTNFHMVDTDGDGKVSAAEFKEGCKNGWIEEGTGKDASPDVPKEWHDCQMFDTWQTRVGTCSAIRWEVGLRELSKNREKTNVLP